MGFLHGPITTSLFKWMSSKTESTIFQCSISITKTGLPFDARVFLPTKDWTITEAQGRSNP